MELLTQMEPEASPVKQRVAPLLGAQWGRSEAIGQVVSVLTVTDKDAAFFG